MDNGLTLLLMSKADRRLKSSVTLTLTLACLRNQSQFHSRTVADSPQADSSRSSH
ncbi:hypothetical protein RvY_04297 [Ramazzottius varieornatus]|uniref:Uncharacterized protein n=1 Tax=Ramazzottius varieornatus TaxID=947166 RepID=A0A1D1UR58_RAMVA|nr:hypothetical protein RvY_04297 [Ramazzottius varieornatus]